MSATARRRADAPDLGELSRRAAAVNMKLAREREVPAAIAREVDGLLGSISHIGGPVWLQVPHDLATHVLTAAIDAQRALAPGSDGAARNRLRSALGRLSQALGLIAEGQPVSPDRSPKELARWLVETLDVPQRELAAVIGVPLRTFQRWASGGERAQPEGDDADRLRLLAAIVGQLRFSLTGPGIVRWLRTKNAWLDGRRPSALLGDPLQRPRLVNAARALREGSG